MLRSLSDAISQVRFSTAGELAVFIRDGARQASSFWSPILSDEVLVEVVLAASGVSAGVLAAFATLTPDRPAGALLQGVVMLGLEHPALSVPMAARWVMAAAFTDTSSPAALMRQWDRFDGPGWLYAASGFTRKEAALADIEQVRLMAAMLGVPQQ